MLRKDNIEGSLGIEEQDIQRLVGDVEGVEDALGEKDAARGVGAARVHGLSECPGIVPAEAVMVHDVEIQGFGEKRTC